MDLTITINGPDGSVSQDMTPDEFEQLEWALIKGADCGMDFCGELLEGLINEHSA